MESRSFTTVRVSATCDRPFEQVVKTIEALSGKSDLQKVSELLASGGTAEEARRSVEAMAGESGLMIFTQFDHGKLLSLAGKSVKAKAYVIGNPLVAVRMTRHDPLVGLYVPWRLYVWEGEDGRVQIAYDKPSSLLAQFQNEEILEVARELDQKLEGLVEAAAG